MNTNENFNINLDWERKTSDFSYENFDRSHQIKLSPQVSIKASASPSYLGDANFPNPEKNLTAAVSSCFFLTFLAIASKSGYQIDKYHDEAHAELSKNENGVFFVSKVTLNPNIAFSGEKIPDEDKFERLKQKAHRNCFIANSIKGEIIINGKIE